MTGRSIRVGYATPLHDDPHIEEIEKCHVPNHSDVGAKTCEQLLPLYREAGRAGMN